MHRLIEPPPGFADGGGRQHADGPGQHRRGVREDVAEDVAGDDHVEVARAADEMHGRRIDIEMRELHIGVIAPDLAHHLAPERHCLQHIGLVHGTDLAAAAARGAEGGVADAADLRFRVAHRVDAIARAGVVAMHAPRRAEVDVAGQLAQHHEVHALDHLAAQGGSAEQFREGVNGAEIGVEIERLAQPQQAVAAALLRRQEVALIGTCCAEQDGIGAACGGQRRLGQRIAGRDQPGIADQRFRHVQLRAIGRHGAQCLDRLGRHLGADAVARQYENARHV